MVEMLECSSGAALITACLCKLASNGSLRLDIVWLDLRLSAGLAHTLQRRSTTEGSRAQLTSGSGSGHTPRRADAVDMLTGLCRRASR